MSDGVEKRDFGEGTWVRYQSHAVNSRRYCLWGGCWPLPPGRIKPSNGKRGGIGSSIVEATTAEHGSVDEKEALGCGLCSGLIHELQMGDVTGPIASCHLVNGFVSDAGQFEAQQMAHHVIA